MAESSSKGRGVRGWFTGISCVLLLGTSPASPAATVVVTMTDDAPSGQPAVFGSLRDAIRNRASAGDTIIFDVRGPVTLRDDLLIPPELYGLTIQGRVVVEVSDGQAGSIQIAADDTTLRDITFRNVSIGVSGSSGGEPRRIQRFTLAASRFQGDARVSIQEVDDCLVTGNRFNVLPRSRNNEALATYRTTRCRVSLNQIRTTHGAAFEDQESTELQLTDNPVLQEDVWIRSSSADIVNNDIKGQLIVIRPDLGGSYGLVRVEDNRVFSIVADRSFLSVIHNQLDGAAPGIRGPVSALYVQNQEPRGPQGPLLIERNTTTGGRNGIQVSSSSSGADVVIQDNDVFGCDERGVLVTSGRNVRISNNRIRECGSGTLGRGIAIGQAAANGVLVENNEVWRIDGSGIAVAPQSTGIEVVLKGNTVQNNLAPGISLLSNDDDLPGLIRMEDNVLTGNAVAGVLAEVNARATIFGGEIRNNAGAGVLVRAGGQVGVHQVGMGGNAGAGIDIDPAGVTPNPQTKSGNRDLDWPEDVRINPTTRRLEGRSAPGSVVEVFTVEEGERTGNPVNGEGAAFLGSTTAGPDGLFSFPSTGTLECPAARLVTLTATLDDGVPATSEFSPDFECILPDVPPVDDDEDNDGIGDATDQCPATPTGETADATGCAESQRDDDGDGVNNAADLCPGTPAGDAVGGDGCGLPSQDSDGDGVVDTDDRCPGPGTAGAMGCQQVIGIPGLGTFFINVAALSTIQSGQEGEGCSDCSVELDDSTSHACFGDADITITGPTAVSSTNCDYAAPALAIDGTGALVSSVVNQGVSCEGSANQCATTSANPDLSGHCGDIECVRTYAPSLIGDGFVDATRVVVSKTAVGGDGEFLLSELGSYGTPYYWFVRTTQGIGDKVAELFFGTEPGLSITEEPQAGWEQGVLCTNSSSGDQEAGTNAVLINAIAGEAFTTWICEFVNTSIADADGDGVPDPDDRCSNPGTNGNECPVQGGNGFVAYFCNDPLRCSFAETGGECSDCTIERLDGTGAISCPSGGACVMRDSTVLQCPSGRCDYSMPNLTGTCAPGTLCTLDVGFSCSSNPDGTGCEGTLGSTGEALGCPGATACGIEVTPEVLYRPGIAAARVDVFKNTEGGDGLFRFDWKMTRVNPFGAVFSYDGTFSIETAGLTGQSAARFYLDPSENGLRVLEQDNSDFALDRIECATAPQDLRVPWTDEVYGVLVEPAAGGFIATSGNSCTFLNVREQVQPDRVAPLPDGHLAGEGVNGDIRTESFDGQMSSSNPVVAVATGTGQVFIDTVTGEVPRAGSDRLSFFGFASYQVLVQPSSALPGFDTIVTAGPSSVAIPFDPVNGWFGFTSVGSNEIVDLVHVGNDNTSPALVEVDRTLNRINVLDPPDDTGVGFANQYPLVTPERLQDAAGKVVSAQAFQLGQLDCSNPCAENLNGIRRGCSTAIDQVLDTEGLAYCTQLWGSECVTTFQSQNQEYCSLPVDQQADFGGMVLVLTDGTPGAEPGEVHLANPAGSILDRVRTVGSVGDDPRRIRCLNGVCAVSNYGSNTLSILTWDGGQNAAITATVTVGDGPVGVDLRQVGANIAILSTGSRDDTYALTTVSPLGVLVDNVVLPIPVGCAGPGHIAWVEGSSQAFATCTGNSSYAVFSPTPPLPPPPP